MLTRCAVVLGITGALAAQITPCLSANAATNAVGTTFTAANPPVPNVFAFRFVQGPVPAVLRAAEIYTQTPSATTAGYMRLEVWTENGGGFPGSPLCGGTWQMHQNLGANWHGTGFEQMPANLAANQPLWLVWHEPGGSRLPYQPGGVTTQVMQLVNNNWVAAAAQPVKWRGWCTQLPGVNVQHTGPGCLSAASTSMTPVAFTNYTPQLGTSSFQVEATGFPSGTLALAILGTNPSWAPVQIPGTPPGCLLRNEALALLAVGVGTGDVQAPHAVGAAGHCWLDFPLPNNPLLGGIVLDTQFAALDPFSAAPLPFVFSSNVRVTLF